MTNGITIPPGYEKRDLPRTFRPDYMKIIALLRQKEISEHSFALSVGKNDAGFFRHWKNGKKCYRSTLEDATEALSLDHWWELWADYAPPTLASEETSHEERLLERMTVETLLTGTASQTSDSPVGFIEEVRNLFPENAALLGKPKVLARVLLALESMEWLVKNKDGTFSRRYWTERECMDSIDYRCGAEAGAIMSVANLQDSTRANYRDNLALYDEIRMDQQDRLEQLSELHYLVCNEQCDEAAVQTISIDDAVHRSWNYTPSTKLSLGFALKNIDHSTNRFVETLRRCRERNIELPTSFPTLPSLVRSYYPQLKVICDKAFSLKPNDSVGFTEIYMLIRNHAMDGFNTASGAEALIERWPQ